MMHKRDIITKAVLGLILVSTGLMKIWKPSYLWFFPGVAPSVVFGILEILIAILLFVPKALPFSALIILFSSVFGTIRFLFFGSKSCGCFGGFVWLEPYE